jgi:hypothetical protein
MAISPINRPKDNTIPKAAARVNFKNCFIKVI